MNRPLSEADAQAAADAYRRHGLTGGARALGLNRKAFDKRVAIAVARGLVSRAECPVEPHSGKPRPAGLTVPALPDEDIDVEELVEHRIKQYAQKAAAIEARKCVPVTVHDDGPIGILWFGDPHVDDDGTDLAALRDHTDLVNGTPGLYAASVGDVSNNWTGRLAKLYAEQGTSARQAWKLAEWLIRRCPWLVLVGGNHDLWSGAGDPLNWIARGQTFLHEASEARFSLNFPNGRRVIINSRHDFAGHSMWNPAHGPMKAAQLGAKDHVYVCGHKHISGYGVLRCPATARVSHALMVGSFKRYDRYAKERGFRDQMLGPSALTVINPALEDSDADMVKVFWNPQAGAEYLTALRKEAR